MKKGFIHVIIVIIALSLFSVNISNYASALSPFVQMNNGVVPEKIICPNVFVLIQKISKNGVACVKPHTSLNLVEHGWKRIEKQVVFFIDKTEYKIGEQITIIMKNTGQDMIMVGSIPIGFTITDEKGHLVCTWQGVMEAVGQLPPNYGITQTWDQKHCDNSGQVKGGTYVIMFTDDANPMPFRIVE